LNSSGLWSMFPRKNVCWCSIFNVIIIIRFCLCSIAKSRQEVSSFLFIFILFFFCFFLLFREFSFSMGYDCVSRDNSQWEFSLPLQRIWDRKIFPPSQTANKCFY
jgi:hypothetical protein